LNPLRIVEEVENAVKADAGPVKGGEVEFVSHSHILRKATWNEDALETCVSTNSAPLVAADETDLVAEFSGFKSTRDKNWHSGH
jgi:hypothetical protein